MHIGVYNSDPDGSPVNFYLKMGEQSFVSTLSEEFKMRNEIFKAVHQGVDAQRASDEERKEKNLSGQQDLTYGEV